jgi:hypothetical protein
VTITYATWQEAGMTESEELDALLRAANVIYARAKELVFDVIPAGEFDAELLSPEQWQVLGELDEAEAKVADFFARSNSPARPRLPIQAPSWHDDPAHTTDPQ